MLDLIRGIHDAGVTVVMVSHDLSGAMRDADKVLVMNRGMDFFGGVEDYRTRFAEGMVSRHG